MDLVLAEPALPQRAVGRLRLSALDDLDERVDRTAGYAERVRGVAQHEEVDAAEERRRIGPGQLRSRELIWHERVADLEVHALRAA